MPFPLASSANCLFHPSKPAAELPHCAASALLAINGSAIRIATAMVLSCPPLGICELLSHSLHQAKRRLIPAWTRRQPVLALQDPSSSCRRARLVLLPGRATPR